MSASTSGRDEYTKGDTSAAAPWWWCPTRVNTSSLDEGTRSNGTCLSLATAAKSGDESAPLLALAFVLSASNMRWIRRRPATNASSTACFPYNHSVKPGASMHGLHSFLPPAQSGERGDPTRPRMKEKVLRPHSAWRFRSRRRYLCRRSHYCSTSNRHPSWWIGGYRL